MRLMTTAKLDWFNDGCRDIRYLERWHNNPLNFDLSQTIYSNWHLDHDERVIGQDPTGRLFQIAADKLMRYHFYPSDVISSTSEFGLNNRWVTVGDRIVQRIHLVRLFTRPILDMIIITEITAVLDEPRCIGYTFTTVENHVTRGSRSVMVEWSLNDQIIFSISAISQPIQHPTHPQTFYLQAFQKYADHLGMTHFINQVRTAVPQPA